MFKKTLLALAMTGFAGAAAAAASTVDANGAGVTATDAIQTISHEGAANDTVVTPLTVDFDIDATQLANYNNVQKIIVDIEGGQLSAATAASMTLTAGAGSDALATNVVSYPTLTRVEFAITGNNADANNDGLTLLTSAAFNISGIAIVADDFNLGSQIKYTVTAESAVAGAAIESVTETITQVVSQFSASATTKAGTGIQIDVEEARKKFTDGGDPKTSTDSDTVAVTIVDDNANIDLLDAVVVANTADFTLSGDFSFLDADNSGAIDAGMTLTGVNAADLQSTTQSNIAGLVGTFTIDTDGSVVFSDQDFTSSVSVDYNTATAGAAVSKFTASSLASGSWTLNGSSDDVAFLPFGSAYAQSITVTNTGSVTGEITVELTAGGTTYTKTLTAIAAAKDVTNISTEVATFAADSGIEGNARLKVVVNAPAANISTKALYYSKADQDRVLTY